MRTSIAVGIAVVLVGTACTGSSETGAPAQQTTTAQVTTTEDPIQPTTAVTSASPSTSASTVATSAPIAPAPDVLRLAPPASTQPFQLRFGPDGVWQAAHTGVYQQVVNGPVTEAADAYLGGIVYQRPGIDNKIFIIGDDGEDKELLVGTGDQTLTLLGTQVDGDDLGRVLYLRRTNGGFDDDSQTLRSYNIETAAVTEIAEVGGWESGTSFTFTESTRLVGRWGAEAYSGLNVLDTSTGDVDFATEAECFYDDYSDSCPVYTDAILTNGDIFGFGPIIEPDGTFSEMGLHRYDLQTETQTLLESWPYSSESAYESNGMMTSAEGLIISLADAQGNPLPALLYDLGTGTATTAPTPGFLRTSYLS